MADLMLIDIDGTLADASHRMHLLPPTNSDEEQWQRFMDPGLVDLDKPIGETWRVIGAAAKYGPYKPVVTTARQARLREVTERWLNRWSAVFECGSTFKAAPLLMRNNDDLRPGLEVKRSHLIALMADGHRVKVAFDDRDDVTEMYRSHGIRVFHVARTNGEY